MNRKKAFAFVLCAALLPPFSLFSARKAEAAPAIRRSVTVCAPHTESGSINPLASLNAADERFQTGGPFTVTGYYKFKKIAAMPKETGNTPAAHVFGRNVSDTNGSWVAFSGRFSATDELSFVGIHLWYMAGELSMGDVVIKNAAGEVVYSMAEDEKLTVGSSCSLVRKSIWFFYNFGEYPDFVTTVSGPAQPAGLLFGSVYEAGKDGLLSGVPFGTTALMLKSNFQNAGEIEVFQNGSRVGDDTPVAGGMTVVYHEGQQDAVTYTLAPLAGDPNNDAVIDIRDLRLAKEYLFGRERGTPASALDLDGSSAVDEQDVTAFRDQILGKKRYPTHSVGAEALLVYANPVGRIQTVNGAAYLEHSASNITLTGDLSGDVYCNLYVEAASYPMDQPGLFVEVDGAMQYYPLNRTEEYVRVKVASGLKPGRHTIAISKSTDARNDSLFLYSVTYSGYLEKSQEAARRIEFLGDSITAGAGVYHQQNEPALFARYGLTASYFSYANRTADLLGADYYAVANGGWQLCYTVSPSYTIQRIYPYATMRDTTSAGRYDFSWKPQVVVINLGTNDWARTQAEIQENVRGLLALVRQKNPDAAIVWAYGAMDHDHPSVAWIKAAVETFARQDKNAYFVHLPENTSGWANHPNVQGQTAIAEVLAKEIRAIMGW